MKVVTAFVIARAEHLVAMKKCLLGEDSPVAVFSDADSLQALAAILARPPKTLVIHQTFAASSRGATLVSRLKSEAHLSGIEVRVLIEDEDKAPLVLAQTILSPEKALLETSRPLDRAGTRQAARYPMNRRAVAVNGEASHLIDLSVTGAQVQVPMRLRPSQVVRFVFPDESTDIRGQATVAWSIAVPAGGTIQYRAGLEFIGPDATRLTAFCTRFGGAPDQKLGAT